MTNKKTYMYECDNCGKKATINLQNVWQTYDIIDDDKFEKTDEWEGDSNKFYCEKCYKKEMSKTN